MGRRRKDRRAGAGRGKGESTDFGNGYQPPAPPAPTRDSLQDFGGCNWGAQPHQEQMSSSSFYSTNSAAPHHEGLVHYEFDLGLIGMESSPVTLLQAMRASNPAPVRPKRRTQTRPT